MVITHTGQGNSCGSKHLEFSEKILDELGKNNIRADIDEENFPLQKKLEKQNLNGSISF